MNITNLKLSHYLIDQFFIYKVHLLEALFYSDLR